MITHAIELIEKGFGALIVKLFEVGEKQVHGIVCKLLARKFPGDEVEKFTRFALLAIPVVAKFRAEPRERTTLSGSLGLLLDYRNRPEEVVFELKYIVSTVTLPRCWPVRSYLAKSLQLVVDPTLQVFTLTLTIGLIVVLGRQGSDTLLLVIL